MIKTEKNYLPSALLSSSFQPYKKICPNLTISMLTTREMGMSGLSMTKYF
jgi:hypothetical protein